MYLLKTVGTIFCLKGPSEVSVRISPNGWAWLVHGRRLVVWRYAKAASGNSHHRMMGGANCRELTLPPSDLSHDAKLVSNRVPTLIFWCVLIQVPLNL